VPAEFTSPFLPGELVLHTTHGLSRYVGTRQLEAADGSTTQYLHLEYAQGDRIFVPVEHVGRLSKYIGDDVALARLNSEVQRRSPYSRFQKPAPAATG
jgi:transcription-repair coupling factor (superfamily II helicase)